MLLTTFIDSLDTALHGTHPEFAIDTKLGGVVSSLKGREALQRHLDQLETWTVTNHVRFNEGKCQILLWDRAALAVCMGWGRRGWRAAVERDLGLWSMAS